VNSQAFADPALPAVCVQGLGFVGAAMAVSIAAAHDSRGKPVYNVIGVDLPNSTGRHAIAALNEGRFPSVTTDTKLMEATRKAHESRNLIATDQDSAYGRAQIIVCDVNLDLAGSKSEPDIRFDGFENAIRSIGRNMKPGALVIVETTVPPGTCERVVAPALKQELQKRGEAGDAFLLAHSFERVMPGAEYFDSIVNFWRVYAGYTPEAARACRAFLERVVNVRDYPLVELGSTTASEMTKVMENSYRAVNIAFIEEWARFAEATGVDLFEVVRAIRHRPTHSNIRQPGFGVGGYCLTKDPLFALVAARKLFDREDLQFPFCERAIEVNDAMPLVSVQKLDAWLGGLANKRIALLGVSYRQDVGDTRYSPAEIFHRAATQRGARIVAHDPLVQRWAELDIELDATLPPAQGLDAVVFAVPHREYRELDIAAWLAGARPLVLDANDVLSGAQRDAARSAGCRVEAIGVGSRS
jgi:UDP-N-acetyl-D-glucosamine dehydrogenase